MKRNIIKPRQCGLKICGVSFTPKNDKGAFCCPAHRLADNKIRRDARDQLFNLMLQNFKHNYHILLLFEAGAIVNVLELKNLRFKFNCMPESDDHLTYWFGGVGIKLLKNSNYQIIKK